MTHILEPFPVIWTSSISISTDQRDGLGKRSDESSHWTGIDALIDRMDGFFLFEHHRSWVSHYVSCKVGRSFQEMAANERNEGRLQLSFS